MITPQSFRVDYPEFASTVTYSNAQVIYWINFATLLINPCLFGGPGDSPPLNPPDNLYDVLIELFTAHNIVLEAQAQKTAANGGIPGLTTGPISSKRVGPAAQTYDVALGVNPDDGQYNLTIYGTRFINLYKLGGAPGIVANGCGNFLFPPSPFSAFGAGPWPGPPLWGFGPWI
jgi:Protein of unknown function (DUF4054)